MANPVIRVNALKEIICLNSPTMVRICMVKVCITNKKDL